MLFGGPAATRWRLGGSAAARPWQRHASLVTRPSLIAIVTIPPMARPRQCCERTLATNCVPGYGWQATMALQDRLSKTGSATLLCSTPRYCVQRPLLCSTPAFVFNARFCVQRPLLCSTPAFVFNARFCVQRPLLCLSPTRWQVTMALPEHEKHTTYIFMKIVKFLLKITKFRSSDVRNAWFGGNGYEIAFSF